MGDKKPAAWGMLVQNLDPFLLYVASFVHMGAIIGIIGPTLLSLAAQTHTTVRAQAVILSLRSIGFFIGSLVAGRAIDKSNKGDVLLLLSLVIASVLTAFVPLASNVFGFAFLSVGQSIACGMIDNLAQVLLIKVFQENLNPFMQSIHCGFGVGCVFAPIIVRNTLMTHHLTHLIFFCDSIFILNLRM